MVKRDFWSQGNVNSFWKNVTENKINSGKTGSNYEFNAVVLQKSKHEDSDIETELKKEKHNYLKCDQRNS